MKTKREWAGDDLRESLRTLMGRKVVLIGRGAIHQQLLAYLAPFQCKISMFGSDYNAAELDQALKQADILVCTVPATPQTNNILDDVAYMQVKDLSKNENEKVFIFNGWTFASDPNLTPFDHAIYDLQLVNCKV